MEINYRLFRRNKNIFSYEGIIKQKEISIIIDVIYMPKVSLVSKEELSRLKNERLVVRDISKRFDNKVILRKITFSINPGEILIIVGPSGSGKSTLLKILCRLIEPDSGQIKLGSINILEQDVLFVRRILTYVAQIPVMFEGTVRDNLLLAPRYLGLHVSEDELAKIIEEVGLNKSFLDMIADNLSVGEKQRVALARALLLDPLILLLDEPTSHLDPENTRILEDLIISLNKRREKTFLIVTHDYNQAKRLGDRVLRLENGELKEFKV